MQVEPLRLAGTYEITLEPHVDGRGHFMRVYDRQTFEKYGIHREWVQMNESRTLRLHTIRGLHFQRPPFSETKLVRVSVGSILDVFVDLRRRSATYGQWDSVEVSSAKHNMVFIPRGFAHGFCTLTEEVIVLYNVDNPHRRDDEGSILWNDPALAIEWPTREPFLSEKDQMARTFADFESPFGDDV
jgi:dTDP-4-dehydrorhamnose 3,5-epimerase